MRRLRPRRSVAAATTAAAVLGAMLAPAAAQNVAEPSANATSADLPFWAQNIKMPQENETTCLRWQTYGCSEIKNRGICERSRDGRKDAFPDLNVYGSPCVWCGEARCTGTSDALCEPLEYLLRGAPAHFPVFLAPGSFTIANCKEQVPLPKLKYDCLLWSQEGCSWIKDRNLCLRSRDGHVNDSYTGNMGLGTPCVWCGGGMCTEMRESQCESFEFLFNGNHVFYDVFHVPEFAEFGSCDSNGAPGIIKFGPDHQVETGDEDIQCGGQDWTGETQCPEGMYCLTRGLNAFCALGQAAPSMFITAGEQVWWHDVVKNSKHMVPPGIDCSKCGCRGNMTIVQEAFIDEIPTGDEFNCGMMDTTPDVPVLASTVGHFVTAGRQVYWHSPRDFQKHRVEPGIDCSRCGCKGNLVLIAQSVLDAMSAGDAYDCGREGHLAPAAVAPVQTDGSNRVQPLPQETEQGGSSFQWPVLAGSAILAACLVGLCFHLMGQQTGRKKKYKRYENKEDPTGSFIGGSESGSSPPQSPASSPPASPATSSLSPVAMVRAMPPVMSPALSPNARVIRNTAPVVMPPRVQVSPPRRVSAANTSLTSLDASQSTSVFDQIDRDHDGQITREEWAKYAFDAFDRGHKGVVSAQDFKQAANSP